MKAQISTEYLFIVGFALLLTIPTIIIFMTQSAKNIDQVNTAQAKQIERKIVENAEKVYYLGAPSTTTIKVVMPSGLDSISIFEREISFRVKTGKSYSDVIEISSVNMTGNISVGSGIKYIRIQSLGDKVNISDG